METIKNQSPMPFSTLAMHKNSHMISKPKPKIRIIHLFAPEIIKTDVDNFRELVQRLTGKPTHEKGYKKKARRAETRCNFSEKLPPVVAAGTKKMEVMRSERIPKEEEGMWNGENSGGFLNGFGDLEFGFIQELGEFPLLPLDASQLHGFEETHQLA
ncbi:hypothetical protein SLA2020_128980 [Shorea laevis]